MPLFIFISGYLAFTPGMDINKIKRKIRNRIVCQLYPTIIFWILYIIINHIYDGWTEFSLISPFYHPYKNGYWFTFALVELFLLSVPLLYLFQHWQVNKFTRGIILFSASVILFLLEPWITYGVNHNTYCNLLFNTLTLGCLCKYGVFFFLGMIAKNFSAFTAIVTKSLCLPISLLGFILYTRFLNPGLSTASFTYIVSGIFGILFLWSLFNFLTKLNNIIAVTLINFLKWIGGMTLEIYLLHFIILKVGRNTLQSMGLKNYINTSVEFPYFLCIAILIVLLIYIMLQSFKWLNLYQYLFPKVKNSLIHYKVSSVTILR